MMMMVNIMSMGWDYVSELQPPTGLLFIPQVIHMSIENHDEIMILREKN
jgi:hypothetical protein